MKYFLDKLIQGVLSDTKSSNGNIYKWKILLNYIGKRHILNKHNRFVLPLDLSNALIHHGIVSEPLDSIIESLVKHRFIIRSNIPLVMRLKYLLDAGNKRHSRYSVAGRIGVTDSDDCLGNGSDNIHGNGNAQLANHLIHAEYSSPYFLNRALILDSILNISCLGRSYKRKKNQKKLERIKTITSDRIFLMNDGIFEKEHFFSFYLNIPQLRFNILELYTIFKYVKRNGLFWKENEKEFIALGHKKGTPSPLLKSFAMLKHQIYKLEKFIELNKNELKEMLKAKSGMKNYLIERYKSIGEHMHKAYILRNSLYKIIYTIKFSDYATSDVMSRIDAQTEKEIDEIIYGFNILKEFEIFKYNFL
ncbi:hypothetical protein TCON_1743 [Astathelohania contejeani]|uniref:Uncharacterized protein n=1 Tax=Astathelohania contejeani TaxID=164912 RepID=A0ABQ7HY03_9MICR|nr:hypothetical protein TCON_1743 [Thelohania contejeani]